MNTTLAVVVSAIVILITALVVITIFGGGMGQIGGATNANAICTSQAVSSCEATNQMPITWDIPTVRDSAGASQTCAQATGKPRSGGCAGFGITTPAPGGVVTSGKKGSGAACSGNMECTSGFCNPGTMSCS